MEKMPKRFQLHLRFDRLLVLCTLHSLPSFVKVFKQSEAGAAVANPREKKRVPIDLGDVRLHFWSKWFAHRNGL